VFVKRWHPIQLVYVGGSMPGADFGLQVLLNGFRPAHVTGQDDHRRALHYTDLIMGLAASHVVTGFSEHNTK
jgi:hypothetical protein